MASHPLDGMVPLTTGHFLVGRALKAYPVETMNFNPTPYNGGLTAIKCHRNFGEDGAMNICNNYKKQ